MPNRTGKENLLPARSIAERNFYLMILPCAHCQGGPFERVSNECTGDNKVDIWYVRCRSCRTGKRLLFARSALLVEDWQEQPGQLPLVNPSAQTSELIDLGQWLALFYVIVGAAAEASDRKESQRLGYEATLCLEEALKFYPADSELPNPNAFFNENSQKRFKEHPEQFTRERLHQMRQKLPSLRVMRASLDRPPSSRPARPGKRGLWDRLRTLFSRRGNRP
jgi:hypothetical protein